MWCFKIIIKSLGIAAGVSSIVGVVLSLISNQVPNSSFFIWIYLGSIVVVFLVAFLILRFNNGYRKIASNGRASICAQYGNILKIEKKFSKNKPIVVIPVNSSFDTIVDKNIETNNKIINKDSIHGQWVDKYAPDIEARLQLQRHIFELLKKRNLKPIKKLPNKRGNKDIYDLGTYIYLEREKCDYLLFALTEFDENNKVIASNPTQFLDLMEKLIKAFDENPNRHFYVPLMGTRLGLFNIDCSQSFNCIKTAFQNNLQKLRSSVTIVIGSKERTKVSTYE